MSGNWQFYISTLLVYIGIDAMAVWALNLQYGLAGILNFAFIVFQAAGAYTTAVLSLGPSTDYAGIQQYFGGARLPFPVPLLAAGVVGAVLSLVMGWVALRRLRADYQAIVMLVMSLIATLVATNNVGLVNGPNGLALVPKPLSSVLRLSPIGTQYQWAFVGITAVICLITYLVVHRLTGSPFGRTLRAIRENEEVAAALAKNVTQLRLVAFMTGGAIAAVSGGLLVEQITAWSPAGWQFPETFSYFAAVIIGGAGNNLGVFVGALLVPVGFLEAARFLPDIGGPNLIGALQWILIGLLIVLFMWFWPRGVIPERRRTFPANR